MLKMPKIKTLNKHVGEAVLLLSVEQHWGWWVLGGGFCFLLAPQRWVEWYFPPHLVFVVSPWRDDLYYLGWEIKEGFFHCDPMKLASYEPRESALIAQLPRRATKCVHEAKQCGGKKQLLCSSSAYRIHDPAV